MPILYYDAIWLHMVHGGYLHHMVPPTIWFPYGIPYVAHIWHHVVNTIMVPYGEWLLLTVFGGGGGGGGVVAAAAAA